jgi:predicted dinucleotide-binding enzyme
VLGIVESIGFRPVDAGSLAVARTLEGMAWLKISRNMQGGTWQDAWVLLGPDSRS